MNWIELPDGSRYTFAADIQKFAELNGYAVPCEADGTRHPGTDCNAKMRSIFKDVGMRRTFKVTEQSVVDVRIEDGIANFNFATELANMGIISSQHLRQGVVQMYAKSAVNALLSMMLNTHVEYECDDTDEVWRFAYLPTKRSHNFEKRKNKPKVSLFKK